MPGSLTKGSLRKDGQAILDLAESAAMLSIRNGQIDILRRSLMDDFVRRAVAHVTRHFPDAGKEMGPDRLRVEIERVIRSGRKAGIESERDLLRFINLAIAFGSKFPDEIPWAKKLLGSIAVAPPDKVDLLVRVGRGALEDAGRFEEYQRSTARSEIVEQEEIGE